MFMRRPAVPSRRRTVPRRVNIKFFSRALDQVQLKKNLNVHAAPRRTVPPPYRPAPREHLIFFPRLREPFIVLYIQAKQKRTKNKKSAHLLSTMILLFFHRF